METLETRSKNVFDKIIYHQQRIATNLTGRLPVTSNRVNKYLFILYNYNSNCILVRPLKNRTDKLFIRVLQDLHGNLNKRGLKPNYMKMRHCQNYKTYWRKSVSTTNLPLQEFTDVTHRRGPLATSRITLLQDSVWRTHTHQWKIGITYLSKQKSRSTSYTCQGWTQECWPKHN